jgi:TPR repeat protein
MSISNLKIFLFSFTFFIAGFSYANGINRASIETMKQQALAGDVLAMNRLGNIYKSGLTSEAYQKPDFSEALKWFELAASKKYAPSIFNIGSLYEKGGFGISRDLEKALLFYETSFNMGFERSREALVNICKIPEARCIFK